MFDRPREFRRTGELFETRIKLAAGETEQARFAAWFSEVKATPGFCKHHPSTRLVLDRATSGIRPVCKERKEYRPFDDSDPAVEPGAFHFTACLCCPACRCAYSLCPPEFHETSFEDFNTSTPERAKALASGRGFAAQVNERGCGFALLVGRPGTGKTRLGCNVIRELDGCDALYIRHGGLTHALRATYGQKNVMLLRAGTEQDDPEDLPAPLKIAQKVRCLVLDEIGCNALANDERLFLDELLKARYDRRAPTILISNLPLDQFKTFVGDALADRIKHASGNGRFILQFSGESYRRQQGEDYLRGLGQ